MLAFTLTVDQLEMFYELCEQLGAITEEQRVLVALEMAQAGHINNVVRTQMTKQEYVEHLAKHFGNVLELKSENEKNGESTNIGFHPGNPSSDPS